MRCRQSLYDCGSAVAAKRYGLTQALVDFRFGPEAEIAPIELPITQPMSN